MSGNTSQHQPPPETPLPILPVFGVCGHSGSGKTHLIERVVPILRERGLRVAVVKHTHHPVDVDRPGKDSLRLFQAGADVYLGAGNETFSRSRIPPDAPEDWMGLCRDYDLVLVEGFKAADFPKVWLETPEGSEIPQTVRGLLARLPAGSDRTGAFLKILEAWHRQIWTRPPLFACVLMGGRSSRMGFPKHLIEHQGKTWIQRTVEILDDFADRIVLAGKGGIPPGLQECVSLPDAPDLQGPMAGVLAAFRWAPGASWLVVACDMPMLSRPSVEWLLSTRAPGVWATLPRLGSSRLEVEPLLAHYDWRTRHLIEALVGKGNFSLAALAGHEKIFSPRPPAPLVLAWRDINTPSELEEVG